MKTLSDPILNAIALRRRTPMVALAAALCLMLLAPAAQALNLNGINRTPAQKFTQEDFRLYRTTIGKALSATQAGETYTWRNDGTQAAGEVELLAIETQGSRECRSVRIRNTIPGLSNEGQYQACRKAGGQWTLR